MEIINYLTTVLVNKNQTGLNWAWCPDYPWRNINNVINTPTKKWDIIQSVFFVYWLFAFACMLHNRWRSLNYALYCLKTRREGENMGKIYKLRSQASVFYTSQVRLSFTLWCRLTPGARNNITRFSRFHALIKRSISADQSARRIQTAL